MILFENFQNQVALDRVCVCVCVCVCVREREREREREGEGERKSERGDGLKCSFWTDTLGKIQEFESLCLVSFPSDIFVSDEYTLSPDFYFGAVLLAVWRV